MKVVRVLTYEGDVNWLEEQLSRSLPNGVKMVGQGFTITINTIVDERPSQEYPDDPRVVEALKEME